MKKIILIVVILLAACGSEPNKTTELTKLAAPTDYLNEARGVNFWLITTDTTPLEFAPNCYGAARYDSTVGGWHIAVVSNYPILQLPIINPPANYRIIGIEAKNVQIQTIPNFDWWQSKLKDNP